MSKNAQYIVNWGEYETYDEALKAAAKQAQRNLEDQVIYQAYKMVKPAPASLPTTEVVDYVPVTSS